MNRDTINVLLVEDNRADALLLRRMLQGAKNPRFEISHAQDLRAGLRSLKSETVDLVLLDLGLPDSDGLATVHGVSMASPSTPIIVLTGNELPQIILEAVKLGARDYFIKSRLKREALIKALLRHALNRQRAQ